MRLILSSITVMTAVAAGFLSFPVKAPPVFAENRGNHYGWDKRDDLYAPLPMPAVASSSPVVSSVARSAPVTIAHIAVSSSPKKTSSRAASSRRSSSPPSSPPVILPLAQEPPAPSGLMMFLGNRTALGYDQPIIDSDAVVSPSHVSADPGVIGTNAAIAASFAAVIGGTAGVFAQLLKTNGRIMHALLRRVPGQLAATGVLIWLLHMLTPGAFAQGTEAAAASVAYLRLPAYALLFFIVVGASNTVFNNMLTAEGERIRLYVRHHRIIGRYLREGKDMQNRWWFIALLFVLYGIVGSYINPSFSLTPGRQLGMAFVIIVAMIMSGYSKDLVRFVMAKSARWDARFKANLIGLGLAVACVWIGRLIHMTPGFIYGLPAGLFIASHAYEKHEGPFETVALFCMLILAFVVWLTIPFAATAPVLHDLLTVLYVILVETLFFEMLPFAYLAGGSIYRWKKSVWALGFAVVVFVLFHTMFNQSSTIAEIEHSPPAVASVMLLGIYAVGVLLLIGYVLWRRRTPVAG